MITKNPVVFWIGYKGFVVTADEASKLVSILSAAPMVESFSDNETPDVRLRMVKSEAEMKLTQVGPGGILSAKDAEAYDNRQSIRYAYSEALRAAKKAKDAEDRSALNIAEGQRVKAEREAAAIGFVFTVDNPEADYPYVKMTKAGEIVSND